MVPCSQYVEGSPLGRNSDEHAGRCSLPDRCLLWNRCCGEVAKFVLCMCGGVIVNDFFLMLSFFFLNTKFLAVFLC